MIPRMIESGPGLSDDDITRAEWRLKVKFPESYTAFLKRHNGGRPVPDGFSDGSGSSTLQMFYSIDDGPCSLVEHVEDIRSIGRIPSEFLPIANDSMANAICIVTKGADIGKVYFWDHGAHDDEMFTELAPDLDTFLATFFD